MLQIIDNSNNDEISAFLTTSFVSHSYEVESTQSIVDLWNKLRKNIKLKDELDYISAVLATGRIMDLGFEVDDPKVLNTIITDINTNIVNRKIESTDLQKELVCAFITAASIARSEEVESIRDIVDLWIQIKEGIIIKDDLDVVAAILTTGRIMELKNRAGGLDFINNIFLNIKKELVKQIKGREINQKDIAAAFITSAYIEVSKKVEKIHDIVASWQKICDNLIVRDQWDYITVILSTGKIKDMDALHIMDKDDLTDNSEKIRTHIENIIGE
ncbi:MAG: hypothetical protein JSV09_04355 [Thermoplasmata archaeon]|nr:MAG: hypothetical protein JSV09_04355 [Thermoplasmata archaeon]